MGASTGHVGGTLCVHAYVLGTFDACVQRREAQGSGRCVQLCVLRSVRHQHNGRHRCPGPVRHGVRVSAAPGWQWWSLGFTWCCCVQHPTPQQVRLRYCRRCTASLALGLLCLQSQPAGSRCAQRVMAWQGGAMRRLPGSFRAWATPHAVVTCACGVRRRCRWAAALCSTSDPQG